MPKIIENLPSRLIAETKDQIERSGYGAMTIRSVAKACGVGVGTVYNYFASKEELVARLLLEDWIQRLARINEVSNSSDRAQPVCLSIYEQLVTFADAHRAIFQDESAAAGFSGSVSRYHGMLRDQLTLPLERFCESRFVAEFAAEALLTWSMAGKSFDEIYSIIKKLF